MDKEKVKKVISRLKVMGVAMGRLEGKAEGSLVKNIVEEELK